MIRCSNWCPLLCSGPFLTPWELASTTRQVKPRLGSTLLLSGPRTHLELWASSLGLTWQLQSRSSHQNLPHSPPHPCLSRWQNSSYLASCISDGTRGPRPDQSRLCDAAAPPYPLTLWTQVTTSGKCVGMDTCLLIPVTSQSWKRVLPTSLETSYLHAPLKFPYGHPLNNPGFPWPLPDRMANGHCPWVSKNSETGALPLFNSFITARQTANNSAHWANLFSPSSIGDVHLPWNCCPQTKRLFLCQ